VRLLAFDLGPAMRGGQRQTALLLSTLASRGHVILLVARRRSPLAAAARASGLDVLEAPAGGEAVPTLLLCAARAARRFRPQIVYAGDARGHGAAFFGRAAAAAPLVVHRRVTFPPGAGPLSRIKYRSAARFLAVSRAVASSLETAGVPARKIALVPDGLPASAFRDGPLPPGPPWRLVHVGAFDGLKGQDVVVDVVARLSAAGIDVSALFLGEGPRRAVTEARAETAGVAARCTFAGAIEDVASRLADSHALLLPSESEGAPLALVEAMAAGCVAVARDVGGAAEMLGGGSAGVLVPSRDVAVWEIAVRDLLGDAARRTRLLSAGRAAARERTIERTADLVEAELERVLREAA
jgi:glycosyltransferase involved in cell wall biosynthesis